MKTAEYILKADSVLQRVYLTGENGSELAKDNRWVGNSDYIRHNGTYRFTFPATDYVGWELTLMCGNVERVTDLPELTSNDSNYFKSFLLGYFRYTEKNDENVPWVGLTAESSSGESGNSFTDVAAGAYCFDAVEWAVAQKITTGKTATTFAPGETCTKAQILTFLWRANG